MYKRHFLIGNSKSFNYSGVFVIPRKFILCFNGQNHAQNLPIFVNFRCFLLTLFVFTINIVSLALVVLFEHFFYFECPFFSAMIFMTIVYAKCTKDLLYRIIIYCYYKCYYIVVLVN